MTNVYFFICKIDYEKLEYFDIEIKFYDGREGVKILVLKSLKCSFSLCARDAKRLNYKRILIDFLAYLIRNSGGSSSLDQAPAMQKEKKNQG